MAITKFERIQQRAFEIYSWRMEYSVEGNEQTDWLEAESEINEEEKWTPRQNYGLGNNEEDNG